MSMCTHTKLPAMGFSVLHTPEPLGVDTVISALQLIARNVSHVALELECFLSKFVMLDMCAKKLIVLSNHPGILTCQAGMTGQREMGRDCGAKDRV